MKFKLHIFMVINLWSFNNIVAVDFLIQSKIKGAIMGAALGDAFARVASNRSYMVDLNECVSSFRDFREEDWVPNSNERRIGIGTENTVILLNQFESLVEGRRFNYSPKKLISLCSRALITIPEQRLSDPYSEFRHFSSKTLQKIKLLAYHNISRLEPKPDARALIRAIPVGLVFLDDIEIVKEIADLEIQLTDTHPSTRIAGIALAVGIAYAVRNIPVDEVIEHMINTAELYEAKLCFMPFDKRPSEYIRFASQEAIKETQPKKLLGTKIGRSITYGKWKGYDPSEALGAAVYCFVRHQGNLKGALADSVHADGNNEIYATLVGALAGAKTGFWALKQEGFESDFELIEKVNVLQAVCNDAYVVLSDYPSYSGSSSRSQVCGLVSDFNRTVLIKNYV